jgi:uncharacterized protein (DUF1501 family)
MISRRQMTRIIASGFCLPLAPINLAKAAITTGRRLVLVELSGANDGLNTVVPHSDERYRALRPNIALSGREVIDIGKNLGLHDGLRALDEAWQTGEMAIVQGLGYPEQNRSHFQSIALWETGGDGTRQGRSGWLTEDIEAGFDAAALDAHGISLDGGMGVFVSSDGMWLSMTSMHQLMNLERMNARSRAESRNNPAMELLLDRANSLNQSIDRITKRITKRRPTDFQMPHGDLSQQFAMALRLIDAEVEAPVLKVRLDGFDTHDYQLWQHRNLLTQLGDGLAAFRRGLRRINQWDNTLIMTYSEFGRRAEENASMGTDHGAAAPHFLLGGQVRGGLWGTVPNLGALNAGDLAHTLDYRSVYNTILSDWFGLSENRFDTFRSDELSTLLA